MIFKHCEDAYSIEVSFSWTWMNELRLINAHVTKIWRARYLITSSWKKNPLLITFQAIKVTYIHNSLWHRWNCFFLALVYHTSSQCLENHSKMFKMFFVYIWRAMSTKGWRRGTPQHIAARTAQPSKQKIDNFHEKKKLNSKSRIFPSNRNICFDFTT